MNEIRNQSMNRAAGLLEYVKESVTPFHAVQAAKERLKEAGFEELPLSGEWKLLPGGKYYTEIFQKTLAAFTVGSQVLENQVPVRLRMAAAHTDYPCLHIKPKAEMISGNYEKLNTEVYGGPILNTWFDRPLSIAGVVAVRGENAFAPELRLFDAKKPVVTLPNLAIHMNRDVNNGVEIKKQAELLALFGQLAKKDAAQAGDEEKEAPGKDNFFLHFLASQLNVAQKDILDFDLFVYNTEEGCLVGMQEEFLSAPRLDNLTSCYAVLNALIENPRENGINVGILFDHEEIGSRSKQGADSAVISMLLEKVYDAIGLGQAALKDDILSGFLLSADVAHAVHPNRSDKYDPINQAAMNDGVVLKINSSQRYTFDTEAIGVVVQLCEQAGIPYKKFVNHSDLAGGGTLGPIISGWLPMKTVDIGVPILAMHSARELMGVRDQEAITNLIGEFYGQK